MQTCFCNFSASNLSWGPKLEITASPCPQILQDFIILIQSKFPKLLLNSKNRLERQTLGDSAVFKIWFSFNLIKTTLLFISWYVIAKLCTPFKNCLFLWDLTSVIRVGLQMINNLNIEQMATFHSCRAGKFSPHGLYYRKLLKSKCGHSILRCINYKLYWSCLLWLGTPAMLET